MNMNRKIEQERKQQRLKNQLGKISFAIALASVFGFLGNFELMHHTVTSPSTTTSSVTPTTTTTNAFSNFDSSGGSVSINSNASGLNGFSGAS
nr:hypothetical protein [Bacilli bacterium]